MAFFKKVKKAINGKWYPQGVTIGGPVGTDKIADELAQISTVSRGDVYAVLADLGSVMARYMALGHTVKLDGVGTFFYTPVMKGQGVDTREEVSVKQILGTRVRFIPESRRASNNRITSRTLVSREVTWEDIDEALGRADET